MNDFAKQIAESMVVKEVPKPQPQQGVTEEKYMLVITRYPNGKTFPRIFPISGAIRKANKPKKVSKKKATKVTIKEEENY